MTEPEALDALRKAAVEYHDAINSALGGSCTDNVSDVVDRAVVALRMAGYTYARTVRPHDQD